MAGSSFAALSAGRPHGDGTTRPKESRLSTKPKVSTSPPETTDIGYESGTTVSPDYTAHTSRFTGKISWVRIDLGDDAKDADHYIESDERFRIAMARQQ